MAALDQLSGETHASLQNGLLQDSGMIRTIVNTRLRSGSGSRSGRVQSAALEDTAATARGEARAKAWVQPYGMLGHFQGDGNSADFTRISGGVLWGFETEVAENLKAGALAGYGHGRVTAEDRAFEADTDSYTLGAYIGSDFGPLRMQFGSSFTWHQIDSSRDVALGSIDEEISAAYNARSYQLFGEAGYTFETPVVELEPFAGLALIYQEADDFVEEGGAAALHVDGSSQTLGVGTLGLRVIQDFMLTSGGNRLSIEGALAWRRAFGELDPESRVRFAEGGESFTVTGAPADVNTLQLETGMTYDLSEHMTLAFGYRGEFGGSSQDNGLHAKFTIRF